MSRLLSAVFRNDLAKITDLLDSEPSRARDVEALCQAIGWGRKEVVKLLLQRGADPNAIDRNGNHPLKMACLSSAEELFGELVRHGSDPARADGLASAAASSGRVDILRYLHEAGCDLNQPSTRSIRPIEAAVGMGHLAAVDYLLSVNVEVVAIDVSKPLKLWKGALPNTEVMEEIRCRIAAKKTEPGAAPNAAAPPRCFYVMPRPQVIDSAKLRATVSAFTDRLAQGDYHGLCHLARASRLAPADVERVVRDYGRHLVPLPASAFEALDLVPVAHSEPQQWSVVVPLWSKEEGRSDLSLELTVEDSPAAAYGVEIEDLHVL